MTTAPDVLSRLKALIVEELDVNVPQDQIVDDAPLFDGGLGLDSIAIVELIALVEDHFGIQFTDEDLVPASFRDVRVLSQVIAGKLVSPPAA
jgi:acyl carrier protein